MFVLKETEEKECILLINLPKTNLAMILLGLFLRDIKKCVIIGLLLIISMFTAK